ELYQNAAEECKKAVYTTVQENEVRAEQYKQTAYFFNKSASSISGAAICLEKVAHVNKEEISYNELWIQKAECHQITAGYYQQAAKAVTQGNHQEGRFLEKAAKLIEGYRRGGYQCLSEAADCLENSDIGEIEGKEKIVTLYTQAKELYQNAAEEYKKAANIMAQGNEEEAQRLDQIAYFIQNSASSISEEASCLKTAANARTGWERESTEFWIQKAECYQISARYYQQAAKAVIQGHDEEGERLEKAAKLIGGGYYSNPGAIEYLSGAIKYDERIKEWFVRKNPTSVVFWTKACEQMKISAEEHRQAALASVEGNTEEVARREEDADSLKWRAERLADAAEYLNKATETGRSNHEKDTDLLNKAILAIETSAEEWRQAQKEDNMVNEATTQASSALSAETAWTEVSLLNVVHLWDEVLKKVRLSEVAWTRAVETCQEKKEQAPEQLKSWWNTEFEKAANSKNHSTCNLPWVEARKLESMANAAGVKVHIAAVGEGEQKPTEASLNQEVQLWEEAITKAQDVEAAWAKCIERYSKICSQTPERLKTNWIDAIEVAKERCAFWHAKIETWNKAKEAEIAAFSARKKALSLTTATTVTPNNSVSSEVDEESKKVMSEEVTQRWNEAIHKAREIETIYANAIKTNQKSYEEASQNYKAWWNAELKIAEDAKACWTAKVAAWEAESNMFNQTCDKTKQLESIVHADQSNITPSALLEGEKTSTKASLKIVADQFLEEITARAEEMKDYWAAKNSWKIESR
ncbi:MAG TPA: hypothetical protein VJK54_05005, partial [Chthoniobacterales bacterium]|nr:hypothetical protein [Chthoniobacterales bacterium]